MNDIIKRIVQIIATLWLCLMGISDFAIYSGLAEGGAAITDFLWLMTHSYIIGFVISFLWWKW